MHTTTLKDVFPEPKVVYRRNFIKENVKSIKQMQGFLMEAGVIQPRQGRSEKKDKYQNVPLPKSFVRSGSNSSPRRVRSNSGDRNENKNPATKLPPRNKMGNNPAPPKLKFDKTKRERSSLAQDKFTDRSMQTERNEDLAKLYETGIIKYPSPGVIPPTSKSPKTALRQRIDSIKARGDVPEDIDQDLQSLSLEEKDYIRENMANIKPKPPRPPQIKVPANAPPNYQRGVLPKYLRDRKEGDLSNEEGDQCPEGHVLLPEEERKETLRVLRQSYADRIQELNSLPVRSDTLRVKKRKMDIEDELKRIDGGIKVFQRPKVYVKINA